MSVGHAFDALVLKASSLSFPAFYFGCGADQVCVDYWMASKRTWLAQNFKDGKIKVPGHTPRPQEMPADLVMGAPALPRLNILIQREDLYPQIPEEVTKTWATHSRHGAAFRKLADSIIEEWGPMPVEVKNNPNGEEGQNPNKRGPDPAAVDLQAEAQKRLKTISEGEGMDLASFPMLASRQTKVVVRMRAGNEILLHNQDTENDAVIKQGTIIAGFGKGAFAYAGQKKKGKGKGKGKDGVEDKDGADGKDGKEDKREVKEVPYRLQDHSTQVLFNSELHSLGKILQEQQAKDPKAQIAYHEVVPQAEGEGFKLKMTADVQFAPAGTTPSAEASKGKPNLQLSAASMVPLSAWDGGLAAQVWAVRWTVNGLMPVRPLIVAAGTFTLSPGQAVQL